MFLPYKDQKCKPENQTHFLGHFPLLAQHLEIWQSSQQPLWLEVAGEQWGRERTAEEMWALKNKHLFQNITSRMRRDTSSWHFHFIEEMQTNDWVRASAALIESVLIALRALLSEITKIDHKSPTQYLKLKKKQKTPKLNLLLTIVRENYAEQVHFLWVEHSANMV